MARKPRIYIPSAKNKGTQPFKGIMVLDFMYMPRVARTVFADLPHHITQRGNRREPVFFKGEDRISHLKTIKKGEATLSYEKIVITDCVKN